MFMDNGRQTMHDWQQTIHDWQQTIHDWQQTMHDRRQTMHYRWPATMYDRWHQIKIDDNSSPWAQGAQMS